MKLRSSPALLWQQGKHGINSRTATLSLLFSDTRWCYVLQRLILWPHITIHFPGLKPISTLRISVTSYWTNHSLNSSSLLTEISPWTTTATRRAVIVKTLLPTYLPVSILPQTSRLSKPTTKFLWTEVLDQHQDSGIFSVKSPPS